MTDQVADNQETRETLSPLAKIMLGLLIIMTSGMIFCIIYLGISIIKTAGEIL
jgi:cell division protein FtsL